MRYVGYGDSISELQILKSLIEAFQVLGFVSKNLKNKNKALWLHLALVYSDLIKTTSNR